MYKLERLPYGYYELEPYITLGFIIKNIKRIT